MMRYLLALFIGLLVVEFVGSLGFVAVYGWRANWRASPLGRHLIAYTTTVTGLIGLSLAGMVWRGSMVVGYLTLAGHILFAGLIWHRFVLLLFYLRSRAPAPDPSAVVAELAELRAAVLDPAATLDELRMLAREGASA